MTGTKRVLVAPSRSRESHSSRICERDNGARRTRGTLTFMDGPGTAFTGYNTCTRGPRRARRGTREG